MTEPPSTRVFSPAEVDDSHAQAVQRTWARYAERVPLVRGPLLGQGGAGAVYRAHDERLRRDVALKVLTATDADAARRFLGEAQILAQLAHPFIAPVYRIGIDDEGNPCFAMKLVEGKTLAEKLRALSAMSAAARVRFALPVLAKICDAVAYAHARGVLHCDLKPDNVMVGAFGDVTLMDWGIARVIARPGAVVVDDVEVARARAGTLEYMAPEQGLDPALVDEQSDVFGLGAILFEIVFQRPPREARDIADLLQEVSLPDAAALSMPRAILDLCARALARDKRDRPPSAAAFKDELDAAVEEKAAVDVREVEAGALILREGDAAAEAYVIVRGTCVAWRDVDGVRLVLRTMGPGDVFGEAAVLDGGTRTASVTAQERVELVVVPAAEIIGRIGARTFVTALARRFRELEALRSSSSG